MLCASQFLQWVWSQLRCQNYLQLEGSNEPLGEDAFDGKFVLFFFTSTHLNDAFTCPSFRIHLDIRTGGVKYIKCTMNAHDKTLIIPKLRRPPIRAHLLGEAYYHCLVLL